MSRVSENGTSANIQFNINRTRKKLDDLQHKGSTLRVVNKPSDNPVDTVEVLSINSREVNNGQFIRNINLAELRLKTSEKAIEQLSEIVKRAKEITIAQASDLYGSKVRKNIASEVMQLRNQALAIGNRRIGNHYIFGGYQSLKPPFDQQGNYLGDAGKVQLEIENDFFVPVNITGEEVFFFKDSSSKLDHPLSSYSDIFKNTLRAKQNHPGQEEDHLSNVQRDFYRKRSIIGQLDMLIKGLKKNDGNIIKDLLDRFDDSMDRLINIRTKIGAISTSVQNSKQALKRQSIDDAETKSKFLDADLAELFSDITKQQQVLKNSYRTAKASLNKNLVDFLD
ncbi:MAG: flagellar hook-associated protein FlgL [Halobacteriovoraceae bacterium]|nr:flagellar hook-associated protein FlgL [Halobacteriovoraceae bacterium]